MSETKPRFSDEDYLRFDPFEGYRDIDVKLHTVKLVVARKEHECVFGLGPYGDGHKIKPGDRYRYEQALIDRDYWGKRRVCLPCLDKFLRYFHGKDDEDDDE